jgi:antitoxin VapB
MASLFIKDPKTAAMASELARRTGATKTAAVRHAIQAALQKLPEQKKARTVEDVKREFSEWRAAHPLVPNPDRKPDKVFFDEMWGER